MSNRGRRALGTLVLSGLILAGCSSSHGSASPKRRSAHPPAALAATYADTPSGPSYALIVNPGRPGSGVVGGVAVYQYQDGKVAPYFSFYGRATSAGPFTVAIKGERETATATFQVAPTGSSITVANCAQLFSPVVGAPALPQPPAPPSCTFNYNLAPGPPRTEPTATTNLVATSAIKTNLLTAYLVENGWQSQYASDISLKAGTTYVGYDPQTGLDWAFATFVYSGPSVSTTGSPGVDMQDGGDTGLFFQVPVQDPPPSYNGWKMAGNVPLPGCYSQTILPTSLMSLWNLTESPSCTDPS